MSVDLEALLGSKPTVGRDVALGLDPETKAARDKEKHRRQNAATGLALTALRRLHRDDYTELYRQAVAKLNRESGPLPGDENGHRS